MSRMIPCVVVSWLVLTSPTVGRADDAEDKAVKFVEKLGGQVVRDEKLPGKPVSEVHLNGTKVTDAGLKELAGLPDLIAVFLYDTGVSDVGLKGIPELKQLTHLDLRNTRCLLY